MEEYEECYWVDGEFPEEHLDELFDWMFEQANVIYSLYDQWEVNFLLQCN